MLFPSIFQDELTDGFMDEMFRFPFDFGKKFGASSFMSTDIKEHENNYELNLELPGFKKEEIQAELKDGYLVINATHNETNDGEEENGKFIRKERYSGSYQRSFYVGDITQEDIKATFENGILKLDIPKKEPFPSVEEKKYISIEG